jgi:putative toxin-antitoxin system antitoxin component (TIGR02293 family)
MPARRAPRLRGFQPKALFRAEPLERVEMLRAGVPAAWAQQQLQRMGVPVSRFCQMCGLARATVDRKMAANGSFEGGEAERVLGFLRLVGQVESMVQQSGEAAVPFPAGRWLAQWLDCPHPALGGRRPGDLLDTGDGRGMVETLLAQMQSGAYS